MSTADALLRAVIDRPDDDLPRLAYADALDESGDTARAEFVRAQVELARRPDHDPARPALEDREHDLLAAHEADWLGELVGPARPPEPRVTSRALPGGQTRVTTAYRRVPRVVEWGWDRGFVREVAADPFSLVELGPALFAAHPLIRWRVTHTDFVTNRDLTEAGRASWAGRLEALDFAGWPDAVDELVTFLRWADLGRLRELDLTGRPGLVALPATLAAAPFRDRLQVLRCGGSQDRPLDLRAAAAALGPARLTELGIPGTDFPAHDLREYLLSGGRDLTRLDLADATLPPDAWRVLRHAPCRLRELDLSGTPLGAFALDRVLGCESTAELRSLELNRCGSAMANVRALAGSRFWRQAEDLWLHNGTIPARALDPLWEQPDGPAALRSLDLSDNYLYDAGVAELAAAEWSGSLGWLALTRNYLTDDAARTIAGSGRFAHLRTLHLSYNHPNWQENADLDAAITEAGVRAMAESPALASLRLLVLNGTALGPAGVEAVLNGPHWRLAGLGLASADLLPAAAGVLADSPRLARLSYLDLSGNLFLGEDVLLPLAESPYLCPLLELDIRGVPASDRVRAALLERLGRRLSE